DGSFFQRSERTDEAGVIEGYVEPAKFCQRAPDQGLDVGLGGNVSLLKDRSAAVFPAFADCRFTAVLVEIGDHHCGALARETDRGGAAHAAGGPGYYCHFVIESAHRATPR